MEQQGGNVRRLSSLFDTFDKEVKSGKDWRVVTRPALDERDGDGGKDEQVVNPVTSKGGKMVFKAAKEHNNNDSSRNGAKDSVKKSPDVDVQRDRCKSNDAQSGKVVGQNNLTSGKITGVDGNRDKDGLSSSGQKGPLIKEVYIGQGNKSVTSISIGDSEGGDAKPVRPVRKKKAERNSGVGTSARNSCEGGENVQSLKEDKEAINKSIDVVYKADVYNNRLENTNRHNSDDVEHKRFTKNKDSNRESFGDENLSGSFTMADDVFAAKEDEEPIYEYIDGRQLNNLAAGSVPAVAGSLQHTVAPSPEHTSILAQQLQALQLAQSQAAAAHAAQGSVPTTPASASSHPPGAAAGFPPHHAASSPALLPGGPTPAVKYHSHLSFSPMPFHVTTGRHVCVSSDRTVAVRLADEYCNGYVFSHRPLLCAETLVVQVLGTDSTFSGGLTFGMTAADPISIFPAELPDDSDLLLDRGEYWVVNKDVCAQPEIGDELSFSLTNEGEVRYGRNGHHVATLMHIDKTLPMWAFFDVYGSVQKIKILGVVSSTSGLARRSPMSASRSSGSQPSPQAAPTPAAATTPGGAGGSLTVALPPPRTPGQGSPSASLSSSSTTTTSVTCDPPPRPPPPGPRPPPQQQQPASASLTASLTGSLSTGRSASPRSPMSSSLSAAAVAVTPPSLPPKQYRHSPVVTATTGGMPLSLPPPLIPTQVHSPLPAAPASPTLPPAPPPPPRTTNPFSPHFTPPSQPPPQPAAKIHPTPPSRGVDSSTGSQRSGANTPQPAGQSTPPAITPRMMETDSQEAADNASNECTVCWERPPNCVIYTCGHMCMCYECAVDIKANRGALCPICRQEIKDIIKIFKS